MHRLTGLDFLLVVAAQAESLSRSGGELYPGDVPIHPYFMAAQAPGRNRRVNCFSFGLICVALNALRRVYILVERNGMSFRESWQNRNRDDITQDCNCFGEDSPGYVRAISVLWDHANLSFCTTLSVVEPVSTALFGKL